MKKKYMAAENVVEILEKGFDLHTLERCYHILTDAGWKQKQLPDLLKAIALWKRDHATAKKYITTTSFQGHPIEKTITGGGGHGVIKDLRRFINKKKSETEQRD